MQYLRSYYKTLHCEPLRLNTLKDTKTACLTPKWYNKHPVSPLWDHLIHGSPLAIVGMAFTPLPLCVPPQCRPGEKRKEKNGHNKNIGTSSFWDIQTQENIVRSEVSQTGNSNENKSFACTTFVCVFSPFLTFYACIYKDDSDIPKNFYCNNVTFSHAILHTALNLWQPRPYWEATRSNIIENSNVKYNVSLFFILFKLVLMLI